MPPSLPPEDGQGHGNSGLVGRGFCWRDLFRGRRLLFLSPLIAAALLLVGYGHYTDPGPSTETRTLVIPHGSTQNVATFLQKEGILASGWSSAFFFRIAVLATEGDGELHAAELVFPSHVSLAHALRILRHSPPVAHTITFPEGVTARRIVLLLQQAPALQGDIPALEEGRVFPQTYSYVWGTERASLVQRAMKLMKAHLDTVWAGRDQMALDGVITTPEQLLVLASLIERESAAPEERPQIARVFLNRLKKSMRLQTDPTVIYALSGGEGKLDRPLTHDDLAVESPYNTYQVTGLPPGPICSPSLESMQAVAHPVEGDMLYFVATGHGGHHFAHTLSEQNAHIRAYRHPQQE